MLIRSVDLYRFDLELVHHLATSGGEHGARPVLLCRIETDEALGIGECEALAAPTYTEEYADGAEAVLAEHLVPRLLAGSPYVTLDAALATLRYVRGHAMAKAGLEMALIDATLRAEGTSLAAWLGARRASIPAGANVGIAPLESVVTQVAEAAAAGYRRVKCKIAPGHDVEALAAVRDAFPELVLSADANGAYDRTDAGHLQALRSIDELGLVALEQPLLPEDLLGHRELARRLTTPVILDESVRSVADLELVIELEAADGVSVKPARLGGLIAARQVHDRCLAVGLHCSIGGMLESGVGRAAAIALGALEGFDLPGDLGASDRYFVPDLTAPHVLRDGELAVPEGPGIGVELDESVLESLVERNRHFEAS